MNIQTGDIIFYESKTFIGKVIRWITKSPYSHVALAVSSTEIIEANSFIKSRIVRIQETEYKRLKVMRTVVPLGPIQKTVLIKNCIDLLDVPYDYKGIFLLLSNILFRFKLDNLKDNHSKLWCTELVDYVYENIGIDLVPDKKNNYVSIQDLEKSPSLYEVGQIMGK